MLTWWLARTEETLPAGTGWLAGAERGRADGMRYTKRRAEYLLARWTLKLAVAGVLGWPAADITALARIETRAAPSGAPLLYVDGEPATVGVSLTDRAGCAVCLVAADSGVVGCDLELAEPRSDGFVQDYFTPAERQLVDAATDRAAAANLVWSAKESALKVLRTGLRQDTRSVEVDLGDGGREPAGAGWSPLAVRSGTTVFPGWWLRAGPWLLTACARAAFPPPAGLDPVPALGGAQPSHRWLDKPLAGPLG